MPDLQAVNFELALPTEEQLTQYVSQTIGDTQAAFNAEFERVFGNGKQSTTDLPSESETQAVFLKKRGDVTELMPRPHRVWTNIRELHVRQFDNEEAEHHWWAAALVLRSCDIGAQSENIISDPRPSLAISYYVHIDTPEDGVEVPDNNPLLVEFGIGNMLDGNVFDGLKSNPKYVSMTTGDIVVERAPRATLVKRAFRVAVEALRPLPDGQVVDPSTVHDDQPNTKQA